MIVAIPHIPESTNYRSLSRAINACGTNHGHSLVVVSTNQTLEAANFFFNNVKDKFTHADHIQLRDVPREGYSLQNDLFREAAWFAANTPAREAEIPDGIFMYLCPTMHPSERKWMELITDEYRAAQKPVLGTPEKHPDTFVDAGGVRVGIDGGHWFSGPIVLPRDFFNTSGLIQNLNSAEHWRTFLRYEFCQSYAKAKFPGTLVSKAKGTARLANPPNKKKPAPAITLEEAMAEQNGTDEEEV